MFFSMIDLSAIRGFQYHFSHCSVVFHPPMAYWLRSLASGMPIGISFVTSVCYIAKVNGVSMQPVRVHLNLKFYSK